MLYCKITVLFWLLVLFMYPIATSSHRTDNAVQLHIKPVWNQTNWLVVATLSNQSQRRYVHEVARSRYRILNRETIDTWTTEVPAGPSSTEFSVDVTEIPLYVELAGWIESQGFPLPRWFPDNKSREEHIIATTRIPSRQPQSSAALPYLP